MRAWVVRKNGAAGQIEMEEVDAPAADAGLVVDVRAAGIGFPDLLMSRGEFQIRQPAPFTLGWEFSGRVRHAPPESPLETGDRVCGISFGAFAEQVVANPQVTFALPEELSFDEGAGLPLNYLTALAALDFRGALRSGERLLVLGASGGAGSAAVGVGKALGAHVTAVVSGASKVEIARAAGADAVIVYEPDWGKKLRTETAGADVIFDPVGGDAFDEATRALSSRGRLIVVGFASGRVPSIAANRLLLRNTDVRGCSWSVLTERPGGFVQAAEDLLGIVGRGGVRPIIGGRHRFEDLPEGLRTLGERKTTGKQILVIGEA